MNTEQKGSEYDPHWQERYVEQISTAQGAVARILPGQRVFVGTGCAQPQELVRALTARSPELFDTEIVHLLTVGGAPYAHAALSRHFRVNSFFISENVRDAIQEGLGDYTPIFLSDIPRLFESGRLPLDVALIMVSPPDTRGLCSLGISVDIVKSAVKNASLVIAQVNRQMPRTLGDSFLSVDNLDLLVPTDVPLLETSPLELTDVTRKVGENIASLVDDGDTLELGIGKIPQATLEFLGDKKDLGIHTEMITDQIIDLIESGVITGSKKSLNRGKIVVSFCLGTKKLYSYIDSNEMFSFQPTEYVNNPAVISRQHHQVAVNVALQVDLTGQVCADSLGTKFFSGIGGQVDFSRGAALSRGGKAIIALPSTTQDGSTSRIVSLLDRGAGVVTTRGDVHYVVTEHGVAQLHGKSIQERALALISIADPEFRAQLIDEAVRLKYIRAEMKDIRSRITGGPAYNNSSLLLDDGTLLNFRPIHPTDLAPMRDFFYSLSKNTKYQRFMYPMKSISQKQIQHLVYVDHHRDVAVVGTVPKADGEIITAVGRYYLDQCTNRAELAITVRDDWQDRGIGSFLMKHLINIARRNGIAGFTAEVMGENHAMQKILHNCGLRSTSVVREGVCSYSIDFE